MLSQKEILKILPHELPSSNGQRLFLYCLRRMGAWGLNDAMASSAMLNSFGMSYRRPLILLRHYVQESAKISNKKIKIAPCCCRRMTHDEKNILCVIHYAMSNPEKAAAYLSLLTGKTDNMHILSSAQALCNAFTDHGFILSSDRVID